MLLLLGIIYLSFISLGLPDSLLGSAWPSMYGGLGVGIDAAGIISVIISAGTVVSSLLSDRVIRRFGTGAVTAASVAMTAAALWGFSVSGGLATLCLCAVPLGLGAGSVDAALNNFVALHYKARHMSWLHCFWGLGASLGPVIMARSLASLNSWSSGYRTISILQLGLAAILIFSLPLWKKAPPARGEDEGEGEKAPPALFLLRLPGAKQVMLAFFCYCAIESSVGLWGGSYLVTVHRFTTTAAAGRISVYYAGITLGRLASGFLAIKLSNRRMITLGQLVIGAGAAMLFLPFGGYYISAALFLIGLGLAPIYPSLIHDTPANFGRGNSQAMIGLQMASAYVGTTLMPPLFGLMGARAGYGLLPVFTAILLFAMAFMTVGLYKGVR
jgi:fucose permease